MGGEANHVVILGIDGLRPDMVNEQTMPNLCALRTAGTWSANHRTVFPSETRGALTALATGSYAETNGIFGNQFYVRDAHPRQVFTETTHDWYAADAQVGGQFVSALSLAEILRRADRHLAVITSSGPGSLPALSWKGQMNGQIGFNVRHPQISYPHDFAARAHRNLKIPSGGVESEGPAAALRVFKNEVWPSYRPAASIIWLTEVDSAAHLQGLGSEQHLERMRLCDHAVGELMEWRKAQPECNDITLLVVSDHGHATIGGLVAVAEELRGAGFAAATSFEDERTNVLVRTGRAIGIWIRQPDQELLRDVFRFMVEQDWYGGAFSPAEAPGETAGVIEGTLALELIGAGGPRAADLFVNLAGNDEPNEWSISGTVLYDAGDYDLRPGGGTHGGLHNAELSSVLATIGAGMDEGVISHAPSSIVDIAPTVLSLLNIERPPSMTGRPLIELMGGTSALLDADETELRSSGALKPTVLAGTKFLDRFYIRHGGVEYLGVAK